MSTTMITPEFIKRDEMTSQEQYINWLTEIKKRVKQAQAKAVVQVNTAMLELYWSIGHDLVALHSEEKWGKGIVKQFALDMRDAFPNDKGFSDTNIKYMKRWYEFYSQSDTINQISHQAGDQLAKGDTDNPSVGLIICKAYDRTIVEWSLQDINKPLGVAAYQLQEVVDRTVAELEQIKK